MRNADGSEEATKWARMPKLAVIFLVVVGIMMVIGHISWQPVENRKVALAASTYVVDTHDQRKNPAVDSRSISEEIQRQLSHFQPKQSMTRPGFVMTKEDMARRLCGKIIRSRFERIGNGKESESIFDQMLVKQDARYAFTVLDGVKQTERSRLARTMSPAEFNFLTSTKKLPRLVSAGKMMLALFDDNSVVEADLDSCQITKVFGRTRDGDVDPRVNGILENGVFKEIHVGKDGCSGYCDNGDHRHGDCGKDGHYDCDCYCNSSNCHCDLA